MVKMKFGKHKNSLNEPLNEQKKMFLKKSNKFMSVRNRNKQVFRLFFGSFELFLCSFEISRRAVLGPLAAAVLATALGPEIV